MNTFTINGKEYKAKAFDFNLVCELEEMGIRLEDTPQKPNAVVRAYFALCSGRGKDYAGKEMEAHIMGGGEFADIMNAMDEEMEASDFFQNLKKNEGTEIAEVESKETEKK